MSEARIPDICLQLAAALLLALASLQPAAAVEFEWGGFEGSLKTTVTAATGLRVEGQDPSLLGKLNVPGQQTLCQPDDCLSLSGNPEPNQRLKNARGSFSGHVTDDGDMNYQRWDPIYGLTKFNSALTVTQDDWLLKATYIGFLDAVNDGFEETHNNTLYQPAHTRRSADVNERVGQRGEFREAFLQYGTELFDRNFSIAVGAQRLRWGEANLHPLNTVDVVNPQDAVLGRQPGLAVNELSIPTNLVQLNAELVDNLSAQAFYQLHWNRTRPEPQGSFFSSNDVIGGRYIEAAPGQFAEDPDARYRPPAPNSLLTSATRRVLVEERSGRNQGQFGLRLNWYAESFLNGTQFGVYLTNYHSRLPYVSVLEASRSCMRRAAMPGNFASAVVACSNATGLFNGTLQTAPSLATEPIPVDTMRAVLDYPSNIQMIGLSFNSTVLGWAVSGEYSFRPNLPAQIQVSDVLFAGVQQAFPTQDTPVLGAALPGLLGTTIPGARTFVPDFISQHRGRTIANGNEFQPGEFVRGWERLKVGQFVINGLKILPGQLGADEITVLAELGFTHVIGMPKDLYFQGATDGTHPGPGADGSGPAPHTTLRLNPTQQTTGFASSFAWGLRGFAQMTYNAVFDTGVVVKPTLIWFEDLQGIAPFPAQNYVAGNRMVQGGLQVLFTQNIEGTVFYQYFDGANNPLRDRDNLQFSIAYSF